MNYPADFWNDKFAAASYLYGTSPNSYFKEQIDVAPKPGRLLLLAEGEGRNAVYAAGKGWEVTAVDFSKKGREKALQLADLHGVEINYLIADIAELNFSAFGQLDVIGLFYAHFPSQTRRQIHQNCVTALSPTGKVWLEAFNPKQLSRQSGGPKNPDMLYTKELLLTDFQGLTAHEAIETAVNLEEGPGHQGLGEVVRLSLVNSTGK
ncbi:MAG: class I SAM-dependent methyltransferase [Lewinellaceae bacterium]|nr:class I SAM-dependent methyltransferase [Saprospiraceae bacterium]MCB9345605.1 class I SAM-dependent methyltransferase [Lewinellaceae bacterium]